MQNQVLCLHLDFKYDAERCNDVRKSLFGKVQRYIRPCHWGAKFTEFVIITAETPEQLVQRLSPVLQMSSVEDWKCFSIIRDVVGKHGVNDPLVTAVANAFDEIGKRSDPHNVRSLKAADVLKNWGVPDSERSAAIKMAMKPRIRDKPQNSDQTKSGVHDLLPEDVFRDLTKPSKGGQ